MNLITIATGLFLLGQLVALLWLHGRALSAAHLANDLDMQIAAKRNAIARTQEKIAAYDASPRIAQWAKERGWEPAQQTDFDDTTDRTPVTPEMAATIVASPSAPEGEANGEESEGRH